MKGYIYRHWIINDKGIVKSYIGQVYNRAPEQRWKKDGSGYKARGGSHKMSRAIEKYGWDSFEHEILLKIECETLEELVFWLDEWERFYIEKYNIIYILIKVVAVFGGRNCTFNNFHIKQHSILGY